MVSLDKAIIGRIERDGHKFEVYLDPDNAYAYLEGKKKDLNNILVVEEVFKDAKKGERCGPELLKKTFGTDDIYRILEIILKHGDVQLTTEQKRKMAEDRRKQIIAIIAKNAIDVRTKAPVPPQRIELAMEEAKIHIDPFKSAEEQVPSVLKALKLILPIKFEKVKIAVKIPANYAMKAYGILKSYDVEREEWSSSGDLFALIVIPAGMQGEFFDKLNKATHGEVETKKIE